MTTELHASAEDIIREITKVAPHVGVELLFEYLPLLGVGCESTLDDKTDKLKEADQALNSALVKVVKCGALITDLKGMILAAQRMRCGGS